MALRNTSTISLRFVVARGQSDKHEQGDWVIVALYGNIGSTTKGMNMKYRLRYESCCMINAI